MKRQTTTQTSTTREGTMRLVDALIRQTDGTLERGTVDLDDGFTQTGETILRGWGDMDGLCFVYNAGGPDVIVANPMEEPEQRDGFITDLRDVPSAEQRILDAAQRDAR